MVRNAEAKKAAKEKGESIVLKRLPLAPREARTVSTKSNLPETLTVQPYGALSSSLFSMTLS